MPKIDTYQARGSLQGAGNNPDMRPLNTAQGLADIGQGLGAVARVSHEADLRAKAEFEKQQEYDAHLWSINQMTDFRNRMVAKMEDDKNYAQPGAEGFALAQNKTYEDSLGELRQQAPNTRAQQLFDVQARQFQDQFFSQALTFEAQEKQRFRVQTTVDYAKKESQALLLNPDLYTSVVVPRLESINAMNVPPSVKDRLREDVSSHFSETVVRGVGNKNPGEALRMLDAGEFNKLPGFNLYGDKLDRLRSHLFSAANQIRSEATTQLRITLEDHLADYSVGKTTEPLPAGYNLTQVKDLLGPAGYKRYQDQIEVMSREKVIAREIRFGDLTSTVERIKGEQATQKALVPYAETITKASRETGVDAGVIAAQIMAESGGNSGAVNKKTATGEPSLGISQFQPATAKQYGVDVNDPHSSISGQARFMKDLLNQFGGDYAKALAAYNWGPSRVEKAVEKYGTDWMSKAPTETQAYVKKILSSSANGVAGAKIAGATADMLQAEAKLRASDPAAAAERNAVELDPTNYPGQPIAARVATRLGIQQNQFKLPEFQQRLLTKDEAQGYVKRIRDAGTLDEAQQIMSQIQQEFVGQSQTPQNKRLYAKFMGELYANGLDKGYMFLDFTRTQAYGNMFAQALKSTSEEEVTAGMTPERIKEVRNALMSNQEYQQFLHMLSITGGTAGGEYAGTFAKTMERAAFLAARDPKTSGSDLIKSMADDLITKQMTVNGTYYVPTRDPYTHKGYDPQRVDKTLSRAAESWKRPNGEVFKPVVKSANPHLSPAYTEESIKDARNLVWLTNEDGSGVYRAVKAKGSPGLFVPIMDAKGLRYEIRFSDVDFLEALLSGRAAVGRVTEAK